MRIGSETKARRGLDGQAAARQGEDATTRSLGSVEPVNLAAKPTDMVLIVLDRDCRIRAVNAAFGKLFRRRPHAVVGKELFAIDGGRWDSPQMRRCCARAFATKRMFHDCLIERDLPGAGRKTLVVSGVVLPHEEGAEPRLLLLIAERDTAAIGGSGEAADATRKVARLPGHGERELRALNARLIAGQEELCKDVARELHDDFSQQLAAIALDLRAAIERAALDSGAARQNLEAITDRLRLAADALHLTSRRLHPGILDDLGLVVALKAECHAFAAALRIPVRFGCNEMAERLDANIALCLYRVAQEALKNVQRHAHARDVQVLLEHRAGRLSLVIDDDGCGFEISCLRDQPCVGLTGMAERVGLLGGEFEIRSALGAGTSVRARVPLRQRGSDG